MFALALLLVRQDVVWLDKLIERDSVFNNTVIERSVGSLDNATVNIKYVQIDGLAHTETKTTRGSKPNLTSWFAYNHQIELRQYLKEDGKFWGEVEDYESYAKLKPNVTIDKFALLVIGGMGIGGRLDVPRRSPFRAQWEALSSVGLGVSLMQETSIRMSKRMLTVTGTVPGIGTFEYVFETGKSLKPKILSKLNDESLNADRSFLDYETVEGVALARMSVTNDETTFLMSATIKVPESKTFNMDWFEEGTLLMTFLGCNVRSGHYSRIVDDIGNKPRTLSELVANRFPHLVKKD